MPKSQTQRWRSFLTGRRPVPKSTSVVIKEIHFSPAIRGVAMVHCGEDLWSEDPARELNNQISELQARVAFPQHWSSGEHEQHIEKPSAHLRKKPSERSIRLLCHGANSSLKNSPTSQLVHGLPTNHSSFTTNSPLPRMALKTSRSSCAASIGDHLTTRFLRGVN